MATVKTQSGCWYVQFTLCMVGLLLFSLPSRSSDPDPLQDFCVQDTKSALSVNGFPCKPATNVTSDDFFFDGLSKEGHTSNPFGSMVTQGKVLAFPGLNTLGIVMNQTVNGIHILPSLFYNCSFPLHVYLALMP